MNFFNNFKIGTKIVLGFTIILTLMIGIGTTLLLSLDNLKDDFIFLVEHDQPVLSNAHELAKLIVDIETGERGFLITGDEEFLEPYNIGMKEFAPLLELEKQLVRDNPSQVKILEEIGQLHNKWLKQAVKPEIAARREMNSDSMTMDEIIKMIQNGTGKKILDKMRVQFDNFIQTEQQLNIERSNIAKYNVNFINNLTIWLNVISIIIGIFLSIYISRNITRPLKKLTVMANNMAVGNMKQTNDLQQENITIRQDEMGDIGRSYEAMTIYFKIIIEDVVQISQNLANGNLQTMPADKYKGDFVQIKDSMEEALFSLDLVIKDIVQVSQGLADGNLRVTSKTEYKGDFVQIKDSMEVALSSLNNVVNDTVQVSQGLATGNLRITPQTEYKGYFVQIKDALEITLLAQSQVIKDIVQVSQGLANGSKNVVAKADYQGDFIQIKIALEDAANKLSEAMEQNAIQNWLKTGQTELIKKISGEQEVIDLAKNICDFLTTYLEAQVGAFYVVENETKIKLISSYAYNQRKGLPSEFQLGEGLVGQAVLEKQKILVTDVPEDYINIQSGIGEAVPRNILIMPFMYENSVKGAIELGSFHKFTSIQLELLEQVMPNIGITLNTAESRTKMQDLLQS